MYKLPLTKQNNIHCWYVYISHKLTDKCKRTKTGEKIWKSEFIVTEKQPDIEAMCKDLNS